MKRLWHQVSLRRRRHLGGVLLIMITASLAEIVSVGAVIPFLGILTSPDMIMLNPYFRDFALSFGFDNSKQLLLPIVLIFIIAVVFAGVVRLFLLWSQARLAFAIGADFSNQIYERSLYQPYSIQISRNSSEVVAAISVKVNSVIYNSLLPALTIMSSGIILFGMLFALVFINATITIFALSGFATIYALMTTLTKKRILNDSKIINTESNRVLKILQEAFGGIRDVLIDSSQPTYCKIYQDADMRLRASQANIQIIASSPRFIVESVGMVVIALVAYRMAAQEAGIAAAIPVLGAMAIGAQRFLPVLQQLYNSWTSVRGGSATLNNILELLEQPLPDGCKLKVKPISFNSSIALKQVDFSYANSTIPVFKSVNLEIKKGSCIGIIGQTGCGKSTLVDLIMGLLQPTKGGVYIDDVLITAENSRAWQAHIAHVPQVIFLTDATIAENIAFGAHKEDIDMDRVKDASEKAKISVAIESWSDKYNTLVGERGVRLSGGQRQRIAIARALYKNADVVVFDEATSALDGDTESAVMDAIHNMADDTTKIIIAHRLSTLSSCDLIYKFECGNLTLVKV